jgi:hypothetical protein
MNSSYLIDKVLKGSSPKQLLSEEDSSRPRTIAVDLDGTICEYNSVPANTIKDSVPPVGNPYPGMIELLQTLKSLGWLVIIWTCRKETSELANYLKQKNIPFDYINYNPFQPSDTSSKLMADVYLDDRAISYSGNTDGLLATIHNFKPFYQR